MGIEKFFNSLKQKYGTEIIYKLDINNLVNDEYLLIDFNSIIHNISYLISQSIKNLYHIFLISNKIKTIYIDQKDIILIHLNNIKTDDDFIIEELINLSDFDSDSNQNEFKKKINFKNLSIDIIDESFFRLLKICFNKLIIHKICNYVLQLIHMIPKLKMIYMAIDGVPLYAKMIEQRRRRYMGYIIDNAKELLLTNYKKILDTEGDYYNQYNFELYTMHFNFNKNSISPGTNFMDIFEIYIIEYLNINVKKNIEIIFDSYKNPGEGEKKIVFKMQNLPLNSNLLIYSPDGDVILLMLLEINKFNIKILRYDNKELYIININKLKDIMMSYMNNNNYYIIKDIVMLFTLLGNDFLPKIEAINTNKHIIVILECYKNLNSNIFADKINWNLLKDFFVLLNIKLKYDKPKKFFRTKEWTIEKNQLVNSNAIEYFKQLFNIEYLSNNYNPDYYEINNNKINKNYNINNKTILKYLTGYLWLFDYYIYHQLKYNYFHYNYYNAPKLTDIINFLNNKDNDIIDIKLYHKLNKYIIPYDKYFTPTLQLNFITPTKLDINLNYTNNLINIFDYLDCNKAAFLSKCNIINIKLQNGKNFLKKKK